MLDLLQLPSRYLSQYGEEKVAEIAGVKPAVVQLWIRSKGWPIEAVQKLLEFDPAPLGEIRPLYESPPVGTKVAILMPTNRKPEPAMMTSIVKMYDPRVMTFKDFSFNSLFHVRNIAAAWYLKSELPWSYWSDDDSVVPCGDAAWFRGVTRLPDVPDVFAGMHTINRFLASGKKMIGVSYVSRKEDGMPQFSGGNSLEIRQTIASGPKNQLLKRDWIGFGGVLVHRDVFLDIIRTQTEELKVNDAVGKQLGYEHRFFSPLPGTDNGDDISFCARAVRAGHEIFVDLALAAGHVGSKVYTFRDIRR